MLYAIIADDIPGTLDKRMAARSAHLARLQELETQGRVVLAGPFPAIDNTEPGPTGFTGSLIIVEFPSLTEAQAWAEADPFVAAGVYGKVSVKPFKKVLPTA